MCTSVLLSDAGGIRLGEIDVDSHSAVHWPSVLFIGIEVEGSSPGRNRVIQSEFDFYFIVKYVISFNVVCCMNAATKRSFIQNIIIFIRDLERSAEQVEQQVFARSRSGARARKLVVFHCSVIY